MFLSLPWYGWAALGGGVLLLLAGSAAASTLPIQPTGAAPLLKKGSKGPWVTYLQHRLGIPPTGTFDDATDAAVRKFQADKGLGVDGVVFTETWKALGVTEIAQPSPKPGGAKPKPSGDSMTMPTTPAAPGSVTATNPFGLPDAVPAREALMLDLFAQGKHDIEWVPVSWQKDGHTVAVLVTRRAVALSNGSDRTIVNMSFNTAQKLADLLGATMLTTKVADEIHKQAGLRIEPIIRTWNYKEGDGGKTFRMLEQSAKVDQTVGDFPGLVSGEGKDYVLTRRFWLPPEGTGKEAPHGVSGSRHNGANFGWYSDAAGLKSPAGLKVHQSIGLVHERPFTDYSQYGRFMKGLQIDGKAEDIAEVLADPARSHLLQDEGGTLPGARHPDL